MSDERTPSSSPGAPTELQQLEAALAAGVITPELFATLSAQLRANAPSAPTPPAPPADPAPPSSSDTELPSLLAMFSPPPASPPPPAPLPQTPAARPVAAPASPPQPAPADATRQLIEERLAQIRQRPPAAPAPPRPAPTPPPQPAPAPAFYPAPPAPTFYPTTPPAEVASPPPARPVPPLASAPPAQPAAGGAGRWLWVLLLGLAVVGGLAYFFTQNSHPDESLASPSLPAAEPAPTEVAAPKPAKKRKKSSKKKRKSSAPAPVAATTEAEAAPEQEAATSQAVAVAAPLARAAPAASQPVAAAPEADDDAATTKVREVLAAYYADLHAPPLHASQHFAPQVERLYIQQNLTPAAIDAELTRSFFPDNQQAVAQIEPGTLRVSAPAADGSRTATFTEAMRLYRVSKQQFQRLRTNVRVRFNADYKITYMRQEKLLANTFE